MDYKIIVLDDIYKEIDNQYTQEMLCKLFAAKKQGYSTNHDEGFLPLSREDFVCNHIMICKEINGDLKPVSISKIILSTTCEKYHMDHPMLVALKGGCSDEYYSYVEGMINDIHAEGGVTSYSGGFTIDRRYVKDREEINTLKEIYCAMHTLIHEDRGVHTLFAYAVIKFKMEAFFGNWGMHPIPMNGEPELVITKEHANVGLYPITAKISELSFYSKSMAKKYKHLWDARLDTKRIEEKVAA
jgi:hypothetical protein